MSLLEVENLSLSIGAVEILHSLSFSVEQGEILAVTGESGSGKSMTALAVMQLQPENTTISGHIRLAENDLLELSDFTSVHEDIHRQAEIARGHARSSDAIAIRNNLNFRE